MPKNDKKRDRYYARFHDLSEALMIVLDPQGNVESLNRKAREVLGYACDEDVVGVGFVDTMIAEDQRPRAHALFSAAAAEKRKGVEAPSGLSPSNVFEIGPPSAPGRRRAVAWKTAYEKDEHGAVREILCWGMDLSAREEDAIWAQRYGEVLGALQTITDDSQNTVESRLHRILELGRETFSMSLAIISRIEGEHYTIEHISGPEGAPGPGTSFDLGETYCSHTLLADGPRYFDYTARSEICTHPCYKKFGLESYIGIPLVVEGKRYGTLNFSDPEPRPRPFNPYDISLIRLLGEWVQNQISHEITQAALREMNEKLSNFKNILDSTLDCVFMFDPETLRFTYVNHGAIAQIGREEKDMLCMSAHDITPDFDETAFRAMLADILDQKERKKTFETTYEGRFATYIPVEVSLQYVEPTSGAPRWVAIVHDISERKKIERMKNEFVSTVSHELRTPMTSINGAIGLLSNAFEDTFSEQAMELFKLTQRNTTRLVRLLDDILDIEKIEAGKMKFHFETFDLARLARQALDETATLANTRKVRLDFRNYIDNALIHADSDRILQVLTNLLSNALKFSPEGTRISVDLDRANAGYRLSIHDQGPGIPDHFHDKIFGKFAQADPSDAKSHSGSGLGLNICKTIVEHHHGEIGFTSPPGAGATFFVVLPRAGKGVHAKHNNGYHAASPS